MNYEIVKIGGVPLKVHAHEMTIKEDGEWRLVECRAYSRDGWKSLKLYLDRPAKKNVWRLGVKGAYMAATSDAALLFEFYPSMRDWVIAQANGRDIPLPANVGAARETIYVPENVKKFVIESIIDRHMSDLLPLSHKSQTKQFGRYVVDMIAEGFGVAPAKAKAYVNAMIDRGIIEFAMIDKHKRISGLRLVKGMNNG